MLHLRRPRPARLLAAAGLLALLVVPACSGSDSSTPSTTPLPTVPAGSWVDKTGKDTVEIQVVDNAFRSQFTKVSPGTKVTFTNVGRNPHNVISVTAGQFTDIPTDKFQPDMSGTITVPTEPGEVPFYCSLHGTPRAGMNGRLLVVADKKK